MHAALAGARLGDDETAWLVDEYVTRQRLKEIGFTEDLGKFPYFKGKCFALISQEIDKARAAKSKQESRRGRKRGR